MGLHVGTRETALVSSPTRARRAGRASSVWDAELCTFQGRARGLPDGPAPARSRHESEQWAKPRVLF